MTKGIAVAKVTDATLHLVHVVKTGGLDPDARSILKEGELTARANEIVAAATEAAELASLEIITSEIEFGNPSKEIRNHIVTNDIHAVVMGTTGRAELTKFFSGASLKSPSGLGQYPSSWSDAQSSVSVK